MRLYETFLLFHAYILFPGKMGSELILQRVDLSVVALVSALEAPVVSCWLDQSH